MRLENPPGYMMPLGISLNIQKKTIHSLIFGVIYSDFSTDTFLGEWLIKVSQITEEFFLDIYYYQ